MNNYIWKNNFISTYTTETHSIRGRVTFKVRENHWLNTSLPVVLLISVHSAFHEDVQGDLKMNAFVTTIKETVRGPITILFAEKAHLQTFCLQYENYISAYHQSLNDAKKLEERYKSYFNDCTIAYWHEHIELDSSYPEARQEIQNLHNTNDLFRNLLLEDAMASYTFLRMQEFTNKELYIEKAVADLLEQCAGLLVLVNKGYRFQFYPGRSNLAVDFVNQYLVPRNRQISWIDVNISIEKKSKFPINSLQQSLL